MLITTLKSKISYACVTHKDLYYVGSITIDEDIMRQACINKNEKVQIVNLNNGERLETYVIPGKPGSNIIGLNGPAARKCELGDEIFIISYAMINPQKETMEPIVIDLKNKVTA
ncbi:MAG: aspartate 1-decarboxylase [Gammaproteobacteria bacterium]|nr:aspartate 1-decarboxylase [Gammaproteobacteria bacterium]